ncbi:hypothetical protein CXIVA_02490 [Clostridium sp. SY8519]|uniref:CobW family GTP-binding protein n=1 Tax=Clostridium sp. (strain SY8519) TaxID=1042156 RepID=UPI0002172091|nr:CobW family GTP-binding protein [Clostridium sp. SY8519]BAK46216.1 hypothetical protein CXIVA_02490 [Clostridium sp. SY8519]
MIKVDIISGFLGAGKTTLIQKLLKESLADEQVVLIENEYGEVGIDGGFLKESGVEIRELNSGCICCTLVGDFSRSLNEVISGYHPDRIIIEPSGVGKLSDVMKSVTPLEGSHGVKLNGLVAVVNAKKAVKQMRAFGEFFNDQIANATTVILSRTQDLTDEALDACVKQIRSLNSKAAVITTPWDDLTGNQILSAVEGQETLMETMLEEFKKAHAGEEEHHHEHEHEHEHHHDHDHEHEHEHEHHHDHDHDHEHEHEHHHDHDHHHHHADEIFTSWGRETPHKYTKEKIEKILKAFVDTEDYGTVLRSKGMVPAEDGTWLYFDMVSGDYEIREGAPEYTGRLVVIGTDLEEQKLEELFELA